jgi:hypothetical protein
MGTVAATGVARVHASWTQECWLRVAIVRGRQQ